MSVARPLLLPLVPLYGAGLRAKNFLYDRGVAGVRSLGRPVISVGSLSAGGAGKTPAVLMLLELMARHGVSADVLSRGYGRSSKLAEEVDPAGTATECGDEPLEIARRGFRVFVGADRYAAGLLAEQRGRAQVHLLDDGFQHRRLARSLEIALLTEQDVNDRLLPAGGLREPLLSLARAQVVLVRKEEAEPLARLVATYTRAEIWVVERELVWAVMPPLRPLVFCGIARPQNFLAMLREAGCTPADAVLLPDHHAYTSGDFKMLVDAARKAGADGFCTTAKDQVKLTADAIARLSAVGRLIVPELRLTLLDKEGAMRRIADVL